MTMRRCIAPALPGGGLVAVLAPRDGLPLRVENEWFFTFLRRHGLSVALLGDDVPSALAKTPFERRRGLVAPEAPSAAPALSPEQRRILRFFPGLLPTVLAEKFGINPAAAGLVPAGPAHWLIPPGWRDRDPRASARDFDGMADVERSDDGLHALAQTFCTSYFAEPQALIALSRKAQFAGSIDLSRDLAERARLAARQPDDIVHAEIRRLQVAIAERRYADVAALPEPSRLAAAEPKDTLRRLRTRGQVRAGELAAADRPLAVLVSRLHNKERLDTDDLQLLADAADARLAANDPGGAFVLAEAIEAALVRDPRHDRRVAFMNALTLARIHRMRGDIRDYRAAVARAYATARGALSLHEILELNLLETAGERDPQAPSVRLAWLRAGLAWLAIEPSEGLSRTAMVAILGKEVPRWQLDIDVSDVMGGALEAAWPELAVPPRPRLPGIRRADGRIAATMMFAGEGAGVLWSPAGGSGVANTRARQRLIRLVLAGLAVVQPRFAAIETGTVLIDTNLGIDIPRNRAEALERRVARRRRRIRLRRRYDHPRRRSPPALRRRSDRHHRADRRRGRGPRGRVAGHLPPPPAAAAPLAGRSAHARARPAAQRFRSLGTGRASRQEPRRGGTRGPPARGGPRDQARRGAGLNLAWIGKRSSVSLFGRPCRGPSRGTRRDDEALRDRPVRRIETGIARALKYNHARHWYFLTTLAGCRRNAIRLCCGGLSRFRHE